MGQSASTAETNNQTTVSTTSVADSYNQSFSEVHNLSDVGNTALNIGSDAINGKDNTLLIFGMLAAIGLFLFIIKKKA